MKNFIVAIVVGLLFPGLALADGGNEFGYTGGVAGSTRLHQTMVYTTELPYDFAPLDLDSPDAEPLPPIDLVSVPFINYAGSIALTVFSLFDSFSLLGILIVLMLAITMLFWLWSFVTDTPSQVSLKFTDAAETGANALDAYSDSLEGQADYEDAVSRRRGIGGGQTRDRITRNRGLAKGLRAGGRLFKRGKRDFGGNPFR